MLIVQQTEMHFAEAAATSSTEYPQNCSHGEESLTTVGANKT